MRIKLVKIPLPADVYATARDEAQRAGFTCVGTKIRRDIEQHYRRIAALRAANCECEADGGAQ